MHQNHGNGGDTSTRLIGKVLVTVCQVTVSDKQSLSPAVTVTGFQPRSLSLLVLVTVTGSHTTVARQLT